MHAPEAATRRPLVLTRDPSLLDDLLRLAAAAGVDLDVAADPQLARRSWATAPAILIGADLVPDALRADFPHRLDVVLVGLDLDDGDIWEQAVRLGAAHVVFLPEAEPWLVEAFADAVEPPGRPATVVGVVGGRGGAGATCLAVALALAGSRRRLRTLLIDADPLGGGVDLALGAEDAAGLRWPDLAGSRGRVPRRALVDSLPRLDDLRVLSWDRGDPLAIAPEAMSALLDTACRGHDLVVVDLPRSVDDATRVALGRTAVTLLVVPAEVRAAAAAGRMGAALGPLCADLRVAVRGPAPGGLPAATIAATLGLPLAGELKAEPSLPEALERGEAPGRRGRGPLARFSARFLDQLGLVAETAVA